MQRQRERGGSGQRGGDIGRCHMLGMWGRGAWQNPQLQRDDMGPTFISTPLVYQSSVQRIEKGGAA